jgi:hypothetical protein
MAVLLLERATQLYDGAIHKTERATLLLGGANI